MTKYIVTILFLFAAFFFSTELDLPVLPPNDVRREQYTIKEPKKAELPLPPPVIIIDDPAPPIFFSEEIPATESIVYVLDFSQSMSAVHERVDYRTTLNRWQIVQREAAKSISALAESFKFDIVVFGTGRECGVLQWKQELQQANEAIKNEAIEWINTFENVAYYGGATPTAPGVLVGLALKPQTIVLLTDGYPSECGLGLGTPPWISHRRRILIENTDGIPINVFGIGIDISYAEEFCKGVASDSSGFFVEIRGIQ